MAVVESAECGIRKIRNRQIIVDIAGTFERETPMDIEAKERLRHIAERLLGTSYMRACDFTASEEEFQETVNALVHHLMKVRKRAQELNMEKLTV